MLSALFACVDFFYQFPAPAGYGAQFLWLDSGVYRRAQGLFYEASTLGNMCAFFLIMIAVTLLRKRAESQFSRLALCLGAPVLFAALVLSYSRASLVNLLVALSALLYLERARIRIGRLRRHRRQLPGGRLASGVAIFSRGCAETIGCIYCIRNSCSRNRRACFRAGWQAGRLIAAFLAAHPWHAILGIGYKTLPYSEFHRTKHRRRQHVPQPAGRDWNRRPGGIPVCSISPSFAPPGAPPGVDDARASFFGTWIFCFWIGQLFQMLSGDLFTYWRVLPLYFWVLAMAAQAKLRIQ